MTTTIRVYTDIIGQPVRLEVMAGDHRKGEALHLAPGQRADVTLSGRDRLCIIEVAGMIPNKPAEP